MATYRPFFGNRASAAPPAAPPSGWLGQLSQAPRIVALPIAAALTWCPQPITPAVAAAPSLGWQGPLSVAPPVVQVARCFSFVPFDTVQPAAVTLATGWQSPLSTAPKLASVPYSQTQLVPRDNPQVSLGWQAPLSIAPVRAVIQGSSLSFVVPPFEVPRGWQSQLSTAPPLLARRDTNQAFPYYPVVVVPDNTVTLDKWQRPLSTAPPIVQAPQSFSYVPFDTVQIVTQVASYGWQQPLSAAPPPVKASQSFAYVPFDTPQVVVSSYGWQSALSVAPQVARAVNTPPSFVPLPFPQVNWGWQPPLSQAVKSNSVAPSQWTFISVPVDVPRGWYQALSVAPLAVKSPQSFAFVPFDTAQATPASISGMAWFTPLGTAPSVPVALRGMSFVPFDTAQVPTPPDNSGQWSGKPRSGIHSGKSRSWKPLKLKKKTEQEELEELIEELRELARLSPKQVPAAAPAVLATYPRPLAEALFDLEKKQSATSLKATISRAQIEAEHALRIKRQQEEDDDDAAFLLLM